MEEPSYGILWCQLPPTRTKYQNVEEKSRLIKKEKVAKLTQLKVKISHYCVTSLGTIVKLFWALVSFLLWDYWTTRSLKYTSSAQNEQVLIYPNTLVRKIILPAYSDILPQLYRILIYINERHFYCSEIESLEIDLYQIFT